MKLKMTPDGKAVEVNDKGNPVVVLEAGDKWNGLPAKAGEEVSVDVVHLLSKIPALNDEAKQHRLKAAEAEKRLDEIQALLDEDAKKDFKSWFENAKKALDTVSNLKGDGVVTKEKLDQLRKDIEGTWAQKLKRLEDEYSAKLSESAQREAKQAELVRKALISSKFSTSPFFSGKEPITTLPADAAEALFGRYFTVEIDKDGEPYVVARIGDRDIFSAEKPGEIATFDEAIAELIKSYPNRDRILSPTAKPGAGSKGSQSGKYNPRVVTPNELSEPGVLEQVASGALTVLIK